MLEKHIYTKNFFSFIEELIKQVEFQKPEEGSLICKGVQAKDMKMLTSVKDFIAKLIIQIMTRCHENSVMTALTGMLI